MVSHLLPDGQIVLPSATGQGQIINVLGGEVGGQGIWGQPSLQEGKGGEAKNPKESKGRTRETHKGESSPQGAAAALRCDDPLLPDQPLALEDMQHPWPPGPQLLWCSCHFTARPKPPYLFLNAPRVAASGCSPDAHAKSPCLAVPMPVQLFLTCILALG